MPVINQKRSLGEQMQPSSDNSCRCSTAMVRISGERSVLAHDVSSGLLQYCRFWFKKLATVVLDQNIHLACG